LHQRSRSLLEQHLTLDLKFCLIELIARQELAEMMGLPTLPKPTNLDFSKKNDPVSEMLNITRKEMTPQEYSNVIGDSGISKPSFATTQAANMGMTTVEAMQGSLDISKLDFVKKAKTVLDLANKKL